MNLKGERFEYEMNMLLECKGKNISIEEIKIDTIYIEENKSSHFRPIIDSIKIYSLF
ncbi:glycosyl transferase [Niallia nealsonii AAU1]|nr:glycosyl transferase [Niallia nealsonii AAU1]